MSTEAPQKTIREQLYEAIQATAVTDDDIEGSVLTGFIVVAEWQDGQGERWLSKISGDYAGQLPPWRERGLVAEILFDYWPGNDDEKEDE